MIAIRVNVSEVQLKALKDYVGELPAATKRRLYRIFLATAMDIQGDAKAKVLTGRHTGTTYRRRGITHRASAPGEYPANDTGTFASSIHYDGNESAMKVTVGSTVLYGLFLEEGTKRAGQVHMEARPWLKPSLEASRSQLQARLNNWRKDI